MNRVGIITIHAIKNPGSLLQAYATVCVVGSLGYDCQLIDYVYPSYSHLKLAEGDENTRRGMVRRILGAVGLLLPLVYFKRRMMRRKALRWLRQVLGRNGLSCTCFRDTLSSLPLYDIYLTGSDQVWNPRYLASDTSFFLDFAPPGTRKIAYAASFGCRSVNEDVKDQYAGFLRQYKAIGVRETSGVGLVREVSGQTAVEVVDPTLLLSHEDYKPLISNRIKQHRFVFCYALSYVFDAGPWIIDLTKAIADHLDAEVVFYGDERGLLAAAKRAGFDIVSGFLEVGDFLGLYEKSLFVVTTSFHGTAFSVNFEKDFYAVLNPNATLDDRVTSILSRMGLTNRGILPGSDIREAVTRLNVNHTESAKRLAQSRKESLAFLEAALRG